MTPTLSVKNFERFQHYKDRSPPWIKLYNELLEDYAFGQLPDASKLHLVAIWLLASRSDNKIPADAVWIARRINATEKVNLHLLVEAGFLVLNQAHERDASKALATCLTREREETEGETEKTAKAVLSHAQITAGFVAFWRVFPKRAGTNSQSNARKKFLTLLKSGADPPAIIAGAERYAAWCAAEGKVGSEYVQQATTWLNQKGWENDYAATVKTTVNGGHSLRDSIETAIAYRRWEEQQEGFRDGSDENVTLLSRLREGAG